MTLVNGVSHVIALDGTVIQRVPSNYIVSAKDFNFVNTKAGLTPEQAIVIEGLYSAALTGFIDTNAKGVRKIEWEDNRRLSSVNQKYTELIEQSSQESIFLINQNLQTQKQKRRKQERQSKSLRKSAESLFGGLLNGGVISTVIDTVKAQITKLLPAGLNFDIDVIYDDAGGITFNGLNVGGITYNNRDGTISYGGALYNAVAQEGLDIVNEQLPDFLNINLTPESIGLGAVTLDLDDLYNNPEQKFQLSNSVSVQNIGEQITVFLGDIPYNVATKTNLVGAGLEQLNRLLPSGLATKAEFKPGSNLPAIGVGPVGIDLATGGLTFDAAGAKDLITNQLESRVFNQLPAPVAAVGRAAWRSLNLGSLVGQGNQDVKVSATDSLVVNGLSQAGESLTPTFNV